MSKYQIPTIDAADYETANSAEIGVETRLFYSQALEYFIGSLQQDVEDAGVYTPQNTYSAPSDLTKGYDMQAVLSKSLQSLGGPFSAQFNCTFAGASMTGVGVGAAGIVTTPQPHGLTTGDSVLIAGVTGATPPVNGVQTVTVTSPTTFTVPVDVTVAGTGGHFNPQGTATATFAAPTYVSDSGNNLPQALAVDLIPDSDNGVRQIRTIDSLATVTNGGPGSQISIFALPNITDWIELGATDEKNWQPPSPEPVKIPDGYNSARWIKMGRTVDPTLDLSFRYLGWSEGIGRINGQRFTLKAETRKDDRLLTERFVFVGVRGSISLKKPDGNGVVMASFKAAYENCLIFT